MNQNSFHNYKAQVYNPGSPHPSPRTEPFKKFPKNSDFSSAIPDPVNPLKITFSAKRKRPSEMDTESPPKQSLKKAENVARKGSIQIF